MSELKTTTTNYWTSAQAFALATVSLVLGVGGGMLGRRVTTRTLAPQGVAPPQVSVPGAPLRESFGSLGAVPSTVDVKQAADQQAAPLVEKLKTDPTNAALLTNLGNIYYDAKQYPNAIQYYERSLKAQPADASVRTDMGTAYWYNGDADTAIAQFQEALSCEPSNGDTLFNLGVVEFQGEHDTEKPMAAWQKLLERNPEYQNKEKVMQLIAQAQNHGIARRHLITT